MSNLNTVSKVEEFETMQPYTIGETGYRPWGQYEVIGVGTDNNGEEYCEKEITVNPGQILSLQSHANRREVWTVVRGTLEVVLNDKHHTLQKGESINIPLHAIHCMANDKNNPPCIVHERQIGICREDDIVRYVDAYGRAGYSGHGDIQDSIATYNHVKDVIGK